MPKKIQSDYWQQRFDQIEQAANNKSVKYTKQLEKKYQKAAQEIDKQINRWYQRIAVNNEITITEARRLLAASELKEFKWNVEAYIAYGQQNAIDQQWMKELENASAKFHINRLEALKLEARQQVEELFAGGQQSMFDTLADVYKETFYRSCFEVQKGIGVGFDVSKLDDKQVSKLLMKPWSVDGTNFSEKLWGNKRKLINTLDQELSKMVLTGESPQKIVANIRKEMNSSQYAATRLVFTEQAYFTSVAQKDSYVELDVEEYEFVGTLDGITCDDCGELDGKHFPVSEMQPGINAAPMHPFCRCTTCPYFNDEFTNGERIAKWEDGKYYYVPEKMTYPKWKNSFVSGVDKDELQQYRPINRSGIMINFIRGNMNITMQQIENSTYSGIMYISDSVKLKPKQMHTIEKSLNDALSIVGGDNPPTCIIISSAEMQTGAICSYNATTNALYIDSIIGDMDKLLELQKDMVCPSNPLSSYIHELLHWKDAETYRKTSKIMNQKEYLTALRIDSKKKLDKLEKQGYNIFVSEYAEMKYILGMYDETLTEYRTLKLLESSG